MLLYYIRSSPLESITREVGKLLMAKSSGEQAVGTASSAAQSALLKAIGDLNDSMDAPLETAH